MAVAFDASTTATRTDTSDPFTFNHTPVGTPKGVVVAVMNYDTATDQVVGVTYGGVSMTEIAQAADTAGEPSNTQMWFLGASIPTGTQTVSVDMVGANGDDMFMVCATVTASTDTEVIDFDSISEDASNPQAVMTAGGRTAIAFAALASGADSAPTPLTGVTNLHSNDSGAERQHFAQQTTPATGNFTIGWTLGTDDVSFVALSVSEIMDEPIRVSQAPVQVAVQPTTQKLRVTQNAVTVAVGPSSQKLRITQNAVLVVKDNTPNDTPSGANFQVYIID